MINFAKRMTKAFTVKLPLILVPLSLHASTLWADADNLKVGVFFGSYGDVDAKNEIEELVTTTMQDADMIPVSKAARFALAKSAWLMGKKKITEEYEKVGYTKYRATSQAQADLVAAKLREASYDARGYIGFAFTFPHVNEGLIKAQRDGINRLIVFYQGAQHSRVTSHIVFREVKKYLQAHPEWKVKVTAVTSFYDDPRFIDLLADSIQKRMDESFPLTKPEDFCIFLPLHGNFMKWLDMGDPSFRQMIFDVNEIKKRFPLSHVSYGFQNHDEIPMLKWTQPRDSEAIKKVAKDPCTSAIINGRITFTIDNLETLYDERIEQKGLLQEASEKAGLSKEIVVEPMFNTEDSFVSFLGDLTVDAMQGKGHLLEISEVAQILPPTFAHPHD